MHHGVVKQTVVLGRWQISAEVSGCQKSVDLLITAGHGEDFRLYHELSGCDAPVTRSVRCWDSEPNRPEEVWQAT